MANLLNIDVDPAGAIAALNLLGVAVERHLMAAAKLSAQSIAREARTRVARRTGATAAGITAEEARDGMGWVVFVNTPPGGFPNLDLVLEFGSKFMTPRPFLNPSAQLEEGSHRRRIEQAIQDAIEEASR